MLMHAEEAAIYFAYTHWAKSPTLLGPELESPSNLMEAEILEGAQTVKCKP